MLERRTLLAHRSDCIDLSMVDNAGNARASMTTANCYLVHEAGAYKLPLVYGNAIKNGIKNTMAYYPDKSGQLRRFKNHNNEDINGPWITKSGSGVDAGMGLTAASAELLWQDKSGLITSVSVNGDYLVFTVGTFSPGNALIAVKDGSGTILWSWHIWATEDDLTNRSVVSTGSHNYTVATVNLGWVPTSNDGKQGYCPYYQWGRKDPFIPCNGTTNGNADKTVYSISGASITGINYSATNVGIGDNIKNPTTFYYGSSYEGPINANYYNMWDALNSSINNVATATRKTIYDPCPPEFCVPTGNLLYYFGGNTNPTGANNNADSNWDSTNRGKTWMLNSVNLYFPAAGFRYYSSGSLNYVGSNGYYWSATPYNDSSCRYLYFNSDKWGWFNFTRALGASVRPVVEK